MSSTHVDVRLHRKFSFASSCDSLYYAQQKVSLIKRGHATGATKSDVSPMSTVKITFALIYGPDAMYVSRCECRGCEELFIQVVHVSTVVREFWVRLKRRRGACHESVTNRMRASFEKNRTLIHTTRAGFCLFLFLCFFLFCRNMKLFTQVCLSDVSISVCLYALRSFNLLNPRCVSVR